MRRLVPGLLLAVGCAQAGLVPDDARPSTSQYPGQLRWTYDNGIVAAERARQHPQPLDTPNPAHDRLAATRTAMIDMPAAVEAAVRFCVGPTGSITSADTETPTGDDRLDRTLRETVRAWTFKPAEFGGLRVEACATATFVLSFR